MMMFRRCSEINIPPLFMIRLLTMILRCYRPVIQDKYTKAEELLEQAKGILEEALRPDHPQIGAVLNSLATLSTQKVNSRKNIWLPVHIAIVALHGIHSINKARSGPSREMRNSSTCGCQVYEVTQQYLAVR